MKKIYLLLIIFLVSGCTNSSKVVFLGDSITQAALHIKGDSIIVNDSIIGYHEYSGFITLIDEKINDDVKLIGKGVSGDKVSDLLTRYEEDVLELNPDIVFIYIGINDVWHKYDYGTGTDIDLYEGGLRQIIGDIKSQGAK